MDDRKLKILGAVVDEYIATGEPVGSKKIMSLLDISISAATIRNEMAELERMGYLEQPHTSAGRVPTYNGYRLYVDKLMLTNPLTDDEKNMLDQMLEEDGLTEDGIVQKASVALAELTKCATVVTNYSPKFSVISKVEVVPTGKKLYVVLLITSSGAVKNKVCRLEMDLTHEQLDFFKNFIHQNLEGLTLDDVSDDLVEKLAMAMGTYMMTLSPLLAGVIEMSKDFINNEVSVNGEKNLLVCQDFDQNQIIKFLENKNEFTQLLDECFTGINVKFSNEDDSFVINNSSIITSRISKQGRPVGSLGIIGPMRLDYAKIIPYIEYITDKVTDLISKEEDE